MDTVQIAAPGVCFEFEGKTFTLSKVTLGMRAEIQEWVRRKAIQNAKACPVESDDERDAQIERKAILRETQKDIIAGHYDQGGDGFMKITKTVEAVAFFVLTRLRRNHPDINESTVRRMLENSKELFEAMSQDGDADPNPTSPAAGK